MSNLKINTTKTHLPLFTPFIYILAVLACVPFLASAQGGTGTITGTISDSFGKAAANLNLAVRNTSLKTTTDENGTYTISDVPAGEQTVLISGVGYHQHRTNVLVKAASTVTLDATVENADFVLKEVAVSGSSHKSFKSDQTSIGTKTLAPLKEVPVSVQVIPQTVLQQLQAVQVADVMRYVSGISNETGFGGRTDVFMIRGFRTNFNSVFKNGFRNNSRIYRDNANIQQIEVLKGPASVLYGVSDPGGLINITTKKPVANPFYKVQLTANNWGMVRPSIDLGNAITADKKLKYRLNAVYEKADSFRDYVAGNVYFISPVLTYDFSDKTSLTVEAEMTNSTRPSDRGILYDGTKVVEVPYSRFFGEPDNREKAVNKLISYNFNHVISDHLRFRHAFNYVRNDERRNIVEQGAWVKNIPGNISRNAQNQRNHDNNFSMQTELYGTFNISKAIENKAIFGVELNKDDFDIMYKRLSYDTLNIYNPVYSRLAKPDFNQANPTQDYKDESRSMGVYIQDYLNVVDRLKMLLGLRFDVYEQRNTNRVKNVLSKQTNTALNPRIGLLYDVLPSLSVFANYSRGFQPVQGLTKENKTLVPESSINYEGGVKGLFCKKKLTVTATYFDITKKNISAADPSDQNFKLQIGEAQSVGLEVDLIGEVLPGLNLLTSYTYMDAKVTKESSTKSAGKGTRLLNVSPHNASLWLSYKLLKGTLHGLGAGAGFTAVQKRPGDVDDSFRIPGYTRYDAGLFYEKSKYRVNINVRNLTNIRYIDGGQRTVSIMPGAPLTVMTTLSYIF